MFGNPPALLHLSNRRRRIRSHATGNIGELKATRLSILENAARVVLFGNLLHESDVLSPVVGQGTLRLVGIATNTERSVTILREFGRREEGLNSLQVLEVDIQASSDTLLLNRLAICDKTSPRLVLELSIVEDENNLEHYTVPLDSIHAQHIASLLHAVLEHDFREGLEDGVQAESVVASGVLPGGDEGVVLVDYELQDRRVVLDGDGKPNIPGMQS